MFKVAVELKSSCGAEVLGIAIGFTVLCRALSLIVVAALPIKVTMTSGESFECDYQGLTATALVIDTGTEKKQIPFDELQSITRVDAPARTGPTFRVTLVGGSQIAAEDTLALKGEKLLIDPRRQPTLTVPIKSVKSIRFRAASPATDPLWLGLLEKKARGDLLAIRRAGNQLDPATGFVESIGKGKVQFNMGGDSIGAPLEKLEGVVFGSAQANNAKAVIRILDQWGSQWVLSDLPPSGKSDPLTLVLAGNVTHKLPIDQIESIYWSGGLTLLATQKPAKSNHETYVKTDLRPELNKTWFGPRTEQDDVLMYGDSSVEYRVEEGFRKLVGSVRRDGSVAKAGEVTVSLFLDDKEVWKETLSDADPRGFELPVEKSRRIRFVTDSGKDGDLGDIVRISRPRLLK